MPLKPLIVAHRGASADATENTLAAFQLAWEQGADAIEGDFHLTADGHVVCHHDATLGRLFPGNGAIADQTLAELKEASAGRIPTLRAFLDTIPPGKGAFLELKTGPEIIEPLAAEITALGHAEPGRLIFMSFRLETVQAARRRFPDHIVNWLVDLTTPSDPAQLVQQAQTLQVDGLGLSRSPLLDRAFLEPMQGAGLAIHIWTEDDPAEARRYAELGVASLTTNRPGFLRQALGGGD